MLTVALAGMLTGTPALASPARTAAVSYRLPPGAWERFQSDLARAKGTGTGRGVTVALLTSGVDPTVGLSGKMTTGPDYIFKPQIPLTHMLGTLMAALIVGVPGVAGVAPDAHILALRTEPDKYEPGNSGFYTGPNLTDTQPINSAAITYAVSHGASVIVLDDYSFADPSSALVSAVNYALSRNVVIVAPEGATGTIPKQYVYPATLPGVIGVSAVTLPGGMPPVARFLDMSNNSIVISGPGNFVFASTDGWGLDGAALAGAYVAGTVALIKEHHPDLSPAMVVRALALSARYHPAGGYSTSVGFGVLDSFGAVTDAGKLARNPLTVQASRGVAAAGAHFGGRPPGVISALPPAKPMTIPDWALIAAGAVLLLTAILLGVLRHHRMAKVAR